MPAEAICPHCQLKLRVPADYGGRSVKCAQCQQRFIVNLPGAVPAAVPAPLASQSTSTFDQLILSVLDEDDDAEADDIDAHVQKVAGPSHFWRCPRCTATWQKKTLAATVLENTRIKAMVRCESCGTAVSYADMQSGQYDAAEITLTCPHCHLDLNGPAEDLLGGVCPGCGHHLPRQ